MTRPEHAGAVLALEAHQVVRLEAMEEWTRSLAGVLTVGIGLEQALVATLRSAPAPIAPEVGRLVARLRARWDTEAALRAFADELDDSTGDLIAANLILGARRRGAGLANVLEGLAESVAADVQSAEKPKTPVDAAVHPSAPHLLTEAEALRKATATKKPVVVDSLTTEKQIVRAVPGRGLVATITAGPVRVKRGGRWVDVDPSLHRDRASGRLMPRAAPAEFSISGGGDAQLAELAGPDGETLSLSWPGEYGTLPTPTIDDDLATYPAVFDGVDLVVSSNVSGFATYLIIHDRDAAANPEIADVHFDLKATGVQVGVDAEGVLSATNAAGKAVFVSSVPEQWDAGEGELKLGEESVSAVQESSVAARHDDAPAPDGLADQQIRRLVERPDAAVSARMDVSFDSATKAEPARVDRTDTSATATSTGRLRLGPDMAMLRDPDTVYPVVLDPSLNPTDIGTDWGMYWSSGEHWYGADDTIPRVGYDGWSSATKKSRSFYKFDVSSLAGTQILSASFVHDQIHSPEHTCSNPDGASIQVWTVEPFGSSMRWPGPDLDAYQARNTQARGSEDYCFQDHYYNEWNVANGLQDAADAGQATFRLGMVAPNEANDMSWRKYRQSGSKYPQLEISYNHKPYTPGRLADLNDNSTQGAAVSYGGKWWLRTHYPILSAAAIDPDGDNVALSFTLKNSSGSQVASHTTGWVKSNSDTQWTTPYMPEGSYTWQVSAKDVHGFGGPTATSGTFVIDTTPPKAPTLTPSSAVASYGQGVSIRIQASDSDVRYYQYGFLTSATPLTSGSMSPLGSAATVARTGHMGPDWITAIALDVAGNKSAAAKAEFKVMGAATSHQWRLDGNGSDQAASEGAPSITATVAGTGQPTAGIVAGLRVLVRPGDPADALDAPRLSTSLYWTMVAGLLALALALAWFLWRLIARLHYRAARDPHRIAGVATRADIAASASKRALLRRGRTFRPSLQHPRAEEIGYLLGRCQRQQIWASVEDSILVIGPPRSGKGLHLVINAILDAPGAVVTTSTRPDNLAATVDARRERGPVAVFDPQHLAEHLSAPNGLRWSPIRGCHEPLTAMIRATGLASSTGMSIGGVESGGFWEGKTRAALQALLHAAALEQLPTRALFEWSLSPSAAADAVGILSGHPRAATGWAESLDSMINADPRTCDSIWMGVSQALSCLADPRVLNAVSPAPGEEFDPVDFLTHNGTLYLLATGAGAGASWALVAALIEDLSETARHLAAASPGARLDPPLLLALDEIGNLAPLPSLPVLMAEGGGTGITTMPILQSLSQARNRWGDHAASAIWDASIVKVILGGASASKDLQELSVLIGERDERTDTISIGDYGSRSLQRSTRRVPTMPPERIRTLPFGTGLVLLRAAPPLVTRLRRWNERRVDPHPCRPRLRRSAAFRLSPSLPAGAQGCSGGALPPNDSCYEETCE